MTSIVWNSQLHLFSALPSGELQHRYYGTSWNVESLGSGIVADQQVGVTIYGSQLHVFANNPDGTTLHRWNVAGNPAWNTETLAAG